MTDTNAPTVSDQSTAGTAAAPVDTQPDPQTEPPTVEAVEDAPRGNTEAAKYRRQLRDAEAQRDTLTGQLAALRRQVAEDASGLTRGSALWAAGVDVAALYDADGRLDQSALRDAVREASALLGLTRTIRPDRAQGAVSRSDAGTSWGDLLRSKNH